MPIDKVMKFIEMQFIEEHLSVEEISELQELMDSDRNDLYIKVCESIRSPRRDSQWIRYHIV